MKPKPPPAARPPVLVGLYRYQDPTGRSGIGLVAWGVIWPDGRVTTWWAMSPAGVHQISVWQHINEISRTNGHGLKTRIVSLGQAAAVAQFDTTPLRALLSSYQHALAAGAAGDVEHLRHAMAAMTALPGLLTAHDALADAYAAQTAELEALRAEHASMQEHLEAIADTTTTKEQPPAWT